MVKHAKMNFKNQHKGNLNCEKCDNGVEETQEHMMECVGWEEERGSLGREVARLRVSHYRAEVERWVQGCTVVLSGVEWCTVLLSGAEWCWVVLRGV